MRTVFSRRQSFFAVRRQSFFAFILTLVACNSSSVKCPTTPVIPERVQNAPRVVVGMDGSEGQRGRASRIEAQIADVVKSSEFECLVTHFDQNRPYGQAGTETAIDECGRAEAFPAPNGLIGYRESRCGAQAFTNEEVYRLFRASPQNCTGADTGTMKIQVMLRSVEAPGQTKQWHSLTETSEFWFDKAKNYEVVGHWIHGHTNRLGFCDEGAEQYSTTIVPYVYGFAACLVAARNEAPDPKPALSTFRASCQSMLGPAFKP